MSALLLSGDDPDPKKEEVYPERYVVLLCFTFMCTLQSLTWNFYGPLGRKILLFANRQKGNVFNNVYGWDNNTIAWLENVANILMFVCIPFTAKALQLMSLKTNTILSGKL